MADLSKKDLFVAIEHGTVWHIERIKTELEKIIASSSKSQIELNWDDNEKLYYTWDNECNLFVEKDVISIRSDKDNVASTDKTFEFPINSVDDIRTAFHSFIDLTNEGEE